MVAPDTVVANVNALFALSVGPDDGAVRIQDCFLEELPGLLGPDPQPRFIEGVYQGQDLGLGEASAEVPDGRGVGDTLGIQGVEMDFIVAP